MIPDRDRLKKLASLSFGKVLDVGCNDNPNIFLRDPIGFDLSDSNKNKAANYQDIIVGDCEELGKYFSKCFFDTIIAGEIIEHLEHPARFFERVQEYIER